MEHLLKHLKLDEMIMKLGINKISDKNDNNNNNQAMRQEDYEKIREEVIKGSIIDESENEKSNLHSDNY